MLATSPTSSHDYSFCEGLEGSEVRQLCAWTIQASRLHLPARLAMLEGSCDAVGMPGRGPCSGRPAR